MFFTSDNAGPAHPEVLAALHEANAGFSDAYGADALTARAQDRVRDVFQAPDAAVYFVATGTAANALALACYCQPWQTVFCSPRAHIHEDECNAPEFFSGGAKLTLVGDRAQMQPDALRAAIAGEENRGVHGPQRGAVSITQVSERGTVHSVNELQDLCAVAREFNLPVHLDGARFANALVTLDCSAAEMSWQAGVDVVSFGGTKNGCLGVEAVVFFDPSKALEFELRRKRAGHLFSKHRYLSAQMLAYLDDDLWLRAARRANANCARLADGMRKHSAIEILEAPDANIIFAALPRKLHQRLVAQGARYHADGDLSVGDPDQMLSARFVCDWSIDTREIDRFIALLDA